MPLLGDMCNGTPNREIQFNTNAFAQVLAIVSLSGVASGHLVKWSTTVRR